MKKHPITKAGDVIIQRKAGMSICAYGTVEDDGVLPSMQLGNYSEATAWAEAWLKTTGGRLIVIDIDDKQETEGV